MILPKQKDLVLSSEKQSFKEPGAGGPNHEHRRLFQLRPEDRKSNLSVLCGETGPVVNAVVAKDAWESAAGIGEILAAVLLVLLEAHLTTGRSPGEGRLQCLSFVSDWDCYEIG